MLFTLPAPETLYAALQARDPAYEGRAWVGVTSTGIFCRLVCPARDPKFENCQFFESVAGCMDAGFRPCKRCKPLEAQAGSDPMVAALLAALRGEPDRRWRESDLVTRGFDPSTVRRAFRRQFGMSFLDMARLTRLRHGASTLARGGRVIEAQLDAGFESASGFRDAFARLIGHSPGSFTGTETLRADFIDTPLGPMIAVADAQALRLLEFAERRALGRELSALQGKDRIGIGRFAATDMIEAELAQFFSGKSALFDTPLAPKGTAFQQKVWAALRTIPPGQTRTYGEMAHQIAQPTATRAVARANGANPIALVIPCHRVIGADGTLTGYGGGLWRKQWLIGHEAALAQTG